MSHTNPYHPTPISDDPHVATQQIYEEFVKVAEALRHLAVESIWIPLLHVEPDKKEEGLIAGADGTDWNPGSGAGIYQWRSGAWVFIG